MVCKSSHVVLLSVAQEEAHIEQTGPVVGQTGFKYRVAKAIYQDTVFWVSAYRLGQTTGWVTGCRRIDFRCDRKTPKLSSLASKNG